MVTLRAIPLKDIITTLVIKIPHSYIYYKRRFFSSSGQFLFTADHGQKGEQEQVRNKGKKFTVTQTKHTSYKSGGHSGYGQYGEGKCNRRLIKRR